MNNNLKVIQLIDSLNPGGAEMMAVNIANALAADGIASYLCATRKEGDLKAKIASNVGYLYLNKTKIIDFKAIKKLNHFIRKHKITTIHAHSSSYFMGFLMKMRNPNTKLIWHDHFGMSENLHLRKKFPLVLISHYFSGVICVNSLLLNWNKKQLKSKQIVYLQNFANFDTNQKVKTILKGVEGKRLVCLANLRPQKDHLNLLKAFLLVHKKYNDCTLHLVGMDLADAYATKIKDFIKSQNLQNHVFLYGSCTDTNAILKQANIGVLASLSEGLPVSLLEYGLAKLPVVVTDVGECSKVVVHQQHGLIVPKSNEVALSEALLMLIENKEKTALYGLALQSNVEKKYGSKDYIKQLRLIYNNEF
ncbi:glycosyltransferase [Lutibacter sp. HS1-25]|uniref:glycosyltransferase n=1 Tax=Lutibacter sp. HS1-25 TaxID=2485000 RepID=UPI0010121F5F|nr:glycosyltransferase [Lutibacter sp. HS1-25]RXP44846.1 glycosyltransferase [Lutibacter sp. HS1-25]